jgi:CRP/FNR family transcriptional regulator, cyclic AMP receptor protein
MTVLDKNRLLLIERVLLLKSLSIFSDTPETILADIAHLLEEQEVAENTCIVSENDIGSCMYIIYRGTVKVHKGKQLLAILEEKDFFGELSLLDTETRSASVTAVSDCILFRIDQEPFYDVMEYCPDVAKGIIKILCKRLRTANLKIMELNRQNWQ